MKRSSTSFLFLEHNEKLDTFTKVVLEYNESVDFFFANLQSLFGQRKGGTKMDKETLNSFNPIHLEHVTEEDVTAISFDDLQMIATILHVDFPTDVRLDPNSDANFSEKGLFENLSQVFHDLPQSLWFTQLNQPYVLSLQRLHLAEMLEVKYFKPRLDEPFGTILLSAENINNALRAVFPPEGDDFLFLSAVRPREINQVFHRLNSSQDHDNLRPFGMVLNTSDAGSGYHWVALLYFPEEQMFDYFDPMNQPPNPTVSTFIEKFGEMTSIYFGFSGWSQPSDKSARHQHGADQCGMYCIWYIVQRMLKGKSKKEVHAVPMPDAKMQKERKKYFRPFEDLLLDARALDAAPIIESICGDESKEVEVRCIDRGRTKQECAELAAKAKRACTERETNTLARQGRKEKKEKKEKGAGKAEKKAAKPKKGKK